MNEENIKTVIISHRGNLCGRNPESENHPDYIHEAISAGFDVEIDIWKIGDDYMLGHDKPRHNVDFAYLLRKAARLWMHAKDLDALKDFAHDDRFNVFCHSNDPRSLTTKGHVWTRSTEEDYDASSVVLRLEFSELRDRNFAGICTNYPKKFREYFAAE